ncbi:hypothetical protein OROMI_024005 [Orobanche minor]
MKKRVAQILFFKIRLSQEILKIRDGTPLEAEEILTYRKKPSKRIDFCGRNLTYIKSPRNGSFWYFSSKLDVPSNVVQKKRVARILFFKIRPSQEILKIRDGTPLEAEEILAYIKKPSKWIGLNKRVSRILFFKIRPSQEILKIRDGTPLEAEEILTYIKALWYFSSKLDVPRNVVQKKRVARILFFKIRPSQEILKIRDGTPLEAEEILTYIKALKMDRFGTFLAKILKIRDGTPLEAEEILTYIKKPSKRIGLLDVSSNVVRKKRVARILFYKIRPSQEILRIRDGIPLKAEEILTYIKKPLKMDRFVARILFFKIRLSQEILKIRDGTPLEAEEILTYIKNPSKWIDLKRVARILFFKIRPSQEILKIRDGTPLKAEEILTYIKKPSKRIAEEILTYIKKPSKWIVLVLSSKLDVPSNVVQKKRVARILFFKIRPSQEILKICDGTPLEEEEILTYIKSPRNGLVWYFSCKLYIPSNVVQKKRVAWIQFFKIRPSQEILKIRDSTPLEGEEILTYIIKPSKWIEILKIRDGTPLEAEEILTYIKALKMDRFEPPQEILKIRDDVPSNVVQKKRVAQILFFKIRLSQEILKIRDEEKSGTDSIFQIRPSQEILKIRDGTPLEAEEILAYIKSPQNRLVWYFSSKLYVPSNVVQKKRVAWILFFKIRPSQEILKIRDSTPLEVEEILTPSQEILKIRDGTPLEAEEILTYIKALWYFSSKLDVPRNVVQKKRVARILFFKIRPSQEILKIRDGTLLEAEEILTYIKIPQNRSIWYFSSKLDVPSNVVQKKRVARILIFKIRLSQEILKIRDGTPLEAEEIWTYRKSPRNGSILYFSSKLDVPSNVVQKIRVARFLQKKRVARILFFKIRPSQEILKIRDEILT